INRTKQQNGQKTSTSRPEHCSRAVEVGATRGVEISDKKVVAKIKYQVVRRRYPLPAIEDWLEILQYIRDQFEVLYQDEPVEIKAIEALTTDFSSVSLQQNEVLIKEISLQEVMDTIDKLPNIKHQ
ncbi:290_t:CDS:2, partial [Gigaspora rosea]